MSVETVLQKLTAHNSGVIGCIATHGEQLHELMPEKYDLIDSAAVAERVNLVFAASDALETEHDPFDQVFLEYEAHGLYARRLEDGVLVLVTDPMQRAQFKKAQVGVNLFLKPLSKALSDAPLPPAEEPVEAAKTQKPVGKSSMIGRIYRGVRY
ncbi:MAG: hypothetical protein AB8B85_03045 [Paracoccaceae bacterium]